MPQSNKDRKVAQRQAYHSAFKKFKFNHGGLFIQKKEQSALGSKGSDSGKGKQGK